MPDQLQLRGGTTAQHTSFTGVSKEVTIDTTKKTAVVHDGSTAGGNPLLREDGSNSALALGSAGTPSLKFTGDLNTGIYSPGADQLAVATNGTGRLFVDSTGRVGVNTSSPTTIASRVIHVSAGAGESSALRVTGNAGTGLDFIQSLNGDGFIYQRDNNPLIFGTNNLERLRVTAAGLVGIGTSSPSAAVHAERNSDLVLLLNRTTTDGEIARFSVGGTTALSFLTSGTTRTIESPNASANLAFKVNGSDRVTITPSGNVGIKTTSPGAALDVSTGSSDIYENIRLYNRSSSNHTRWGITCNHGDNTKANVSLINGISLSDNTSNIISIGGGEVGSGFCGVSTIAFRTTSTPGTASSATERARIDSSGRLLVGTSSVISDEQFNVTSGNQIGFYLKNASGSGEYTFKCWNATGTGDTLWIDFLNETTQTRRGSIDYNRAAGQVRYNVTSDRRLKSDIQSAGTALDALSAIQVRSYKWAETGYQVDHGFIAQELNEIAPDAVKVGDNGEEVTDTWGVDNGKLVPLLTKALQEAIAKIETLEAKVAALESA